MGKSFMNLRLIAITAIVLFSVSCSDSNTGKGKSESGELLSSGTPETALPLEPIDSARVIQIAAMLPEKPAGFGQNYHARAAWDSLGKSPDYRNVISVAGAIVNSPFPEWNDEAYLTFFTKGTRPEGEKMLRDRSGRLSPLVVAECIENKGRFIPAIELTLKELMKQKSWTLPAHDKQKQNFEGKNYTVDLNAAGFGHTVAQVLYLLDDKLSPAIRKEVLDELFKRIFNPVLNSVKTKNNDNWWLTTTNNWNAVCLAGVTGAALAAIPDKTERAKFVTIAERYSRNSITGYANDGYCSEGLGYFAYGFGNYIVLREELLQATGGEIDLFAGEKLKRIGAYAPNMEIMNNNYPSIADCRPGTKAPPEILWYCSRNLGLGLEKYDTINVKGSPGNITTGLMYSFPNSASESNVPAGGNKFSPGIRSDFNYAGVLIVRPAKGTQCQIAAALKGGNNDEHHNHNDVGSYSIVAGDEMLMGDPGGPFMYRSNTFGPERYTAYKNLASYGHPVPLVAGEQQSPGRNAEAKIIKKSFSEKKDLFVMDIASAYKVEGLKLIRSFVYDRRADGKLTVKDEFSYKKPETFETALITRAACRKISETELEFSGTKNKMTASLKTSADCEISFETIKGDFPDFTRVSIKLKEPVKSGKVEIIYMPVR